MSDFREELRVGKQILQRVVEAYRKIRNTGRFLLANLYDFDPARDLVPLAAMHDVDRYAVARYADTAVEILDAYDAYDFQTIFQRINQLTTVDLSAFYADVSKDRLYTFAANSKERRSAQTAMYLIGDGLARLLGPILPFTSDELWRHLPGLREPSVHIAEFPPRTEVATLVDRDLVDRWQRLIALRDDVNRALESARQGKTIGNSLGARVALIASGPTGALLQRYRDDLPMLFIVSQVSLEVRDGGEDLLAIDVARAEGHKCGRCWRMVEAISSNPGTDGLCDRCVDAVGGGSRAA
jgi:isoleucyl-tRNA synthetase